MGTGEELRRLAEGIIDSYEGRVNTVCALMSQAHEVLVTYRSDLSSMVGAVRSNLAVSQSLRRKDFDAMVGEVLERHHRIEAEAAGHLTQFRLEEEAVIGRLRHIICNGCVTPLEEVEFIREEILTRQKERELKVIGILKRFQVEQVELKIGLRKLLDKGESVKVKDLKTMLKAIRAQQSETNQTLFAFLDDFDRMRSRVQGQWQQVARLSS